MANPLSILKKATKPKVTVEVEEQEPKINEMVEKVFTTRNLVHFAHWKTNSFAAHTALGELYDGIVDEVDDIVETYQGEFGLLKDLEIDACCQPDDIIAKIKEDSEWIKSNRVGIANGSTTIENMLDSLTGTYNKVLYKLTNLH